jgi:hypothetical protein
VIGERRLRLTCRRDDVADRRDVRPEVPIELGIGQVEEGLHLEALVAIEHVDGQQAADLRPVRRDPAGMPCVADPPHAQLAPLPVTDRVDPIQLVRLSVLA